MVRKIYFVMLCFTLCFSSFAGRKNRSVPQRKINLKQERRASKNFTINGEPRFSSLKYNFKKNAQLKFDLSDPIQCLLFFASLGGALGFAEGQSCFKNSPVNERPLCPQDQIREACLQPYRGSINQAFIPSLPRNTGLFLFGCGTEKEQVQDFDKRMSEPMYSWVSSMPADWRYNLWIPFSLFDGGIDGAIIKRSQAHLCEELRKNGADTSNVYLRDIGDLNDVKTHPEVFKESTPIFLQADASRLSILIEEIERMKEELGENSKAFAFYADLDPRALPFDEILNAENTATVDRHGFAMFRPQNNKLAPWPSFMVLTSEASLTQLKKYLYKALHEIEHYNPALNSHVQTLITIWYIEQERPEVVGILNKIRQEVLDLSLDYPAILVFRLSYHFQHKLSDESRKGLIAIIRNYLKDGDSRELVIAKIIGHKDFYKLSSSYLSWFISSKYELYDDLMVYQRFYAEGMIDPVEFREFLISFPCLQGIIGTTERKAFEIACPIEKKN